MWWWWWYHSKHMKKIEIFLKCDILAELSKNDGFCDRETNVIGNCGTCKIAEKFLKEKAKNAPGGTTITFSAKENKANINYYGSDVNDKNRIKLVDIIVIRGKLTTKQIPTD